MRYCFFSGYADLKGGYTTLLISLIKGLTKVGEETILINYKNGLIERELVKNGINIKVVDIGELNSENVSLLFSSKDIFVISRFHEYLNIFMKVNPGVIYYDINDYIGEISDYKFGIKLKRLSKKLVSELIAKNSLLFMDDTGVENLKSQFGITVSEPKYLPIPVEISSNENLYLDKPRNTSGVIHITYIGRSVDWKLTILEKILGDCLDLKYHFNFHILVDNKSELHKILPLDKYSFKNVSFKIYENLPPSEIGDFLVANADLHFGMGTTALHAAMLGIPTILVDASKNKIPENYTYSWLYETENFCLGRFIEKRGFKAGMQMQELIESTQNEESFANISNLTFQYVISNHKIDNVVQRLINYTSRSSFRLKDARYLVPFYFGLHQLVKKFLKRTPLSK